MNLNLRKITQVDRYWPPRYVVKLSFDDHVRSDIMNKFANIGREYGGIRPVTLPDGLGFRMYFDDEESARIAVGAMRAESQYERMEGSYKIEHDVFSTEANLYEPQLLESGRLMPFGYIPDVDYEPEP